MQKRRRDLSSRVCAILLRKFLAVATALLSFALPLSLHSQTGTVDVPGGQIVVTNAAAVTTLDDQTVSYNAETGGPYVDCFAQNSKGACM